MKFVRITLALVALVAMAIAAGPSFVTGPVEAAPKTGGDTFIYYGGFELGGSFDDPLFYDQATCNITCANGDRHTTEAEDIDECVEDCNRECNTTTCRPA